VGHEPVEFGESAGVEQQVQPLPGGELSLLVLLRDACCTTAFLSGRAAMMQVVEEVAG
jgi:hypothetical protein